MKAAFGLTLFGALFVLTQASCPWVAYHSCVEEEKPTKCKAKEVCKEGYKESCGSETCEYPYKCAYATKEECKKFAVLKEKCEEKKSCKKVKKACGDGYCYLDQDCVKETKCFVKKFGYGRKLLDSGAYAHSYSHAFTGYKPYYEKEDEKEEAEEEEEDEKEDDEKKDKHYYHYKKKLVCEDEYTCVAKEECKDVTVKRCVKKELREGVDYCDGGHHFYWYYIHEGEKCGDEYCGYGYDCAEVIIQKCETECGDETCEYGYECVAEDEECEEYTLLETVCKDVYKPTCVPLSPYVLLTYKPPCKTVYECEKEESVCGDEYCPEGYSCAIDYKKTCGYGYYPAHGSPVVSKPEKEEDEEEKKYYYIKIEKEEEDDKEDDKEEEDEDDKEEDEDDKEEDEDDKGGSASSHSSASAGKHGSTSTARTHATGSGKASAHGHGKGDGSKAKAGSYSGDGKADSYGEAHADEDKHAYAGAGAHYDSEP